MLERVVPILSYKPMLSIPQSQQAIQRHQQAGMCSEYNIPQSCRKRILFHRESHPFDNQVDARNA